MLQYIRRNYRKLCHEGVAKVIDKQIFAALEIADHEIRLIVGEFFNTRFNIIKVERVESMGIEGQRIVNEGLVIKNIKKAVQNASQLIGADIESVLLCIPSIRAKRIARKISVDITSIDNRVTMNDVRNAIKQATLSEIPADLELINVVCAKYTTGGISSRRAPINEICTKLTVDIDLLCADRKVAYEYASCIEKAGLEILDVSLDAYAISKEAALLEQAIDHNVILIKLERQTTTLVLLNQGRVANLEVLDRGMDEWIIPVSQNYHLPQDVASRLIKYNTRLGLDKYSDSPIYIWAVEGKTMTLSEKQLYDKVNENIESWLDEMHTLCRPILQAGNVTVIVTGEGGDMQGLDQCLKNQLEVDTKNYCPETIGVRHSSLSSCLGLFYAYKDQLPISLNDSTSVNMLEFEKTVTTNSKVKVNNDSEISITKKLKGMFDPKRNK